MLLKQIWDVISNHPGTVSGIIIIFLSLVEVSKIKLNPWTALGTLIGRFLGIKALSDKLDATNKKVDATNKKVDELDNKIDENDAVAARVRILRFASEIMDRRYHNKDSWDQTMIDTAKYEGYVTAHPKFKNGITEPTIEYIKDQYRERMEKNDWDRKND